MLTRTPYTSGVAGAATTFEWDDWDMIRAVPPAGGSPVTSTYNVVADAIGSIRAITDSTGAVVAHYEYDAWGNLLPSSSPLSIGYCYCSIGAHGVRTDIDLGLYSVRQRWYDAGLQRFISRDPLGVTSNLYVYCNNSPQNLIDPEGENAIAIRDAAALAVEILVAAESALVLSEVALTLAGTGCVAAVSGMGMASLAARGRSTLDIEDVRADNWQRAFDRLEMAQVKEIRYTQDGKSVNRVIAGRQRWCKQQYERDIARCEILMKCDCDKLGGYAPSEARAVCRRGAMQRLGVCERNSTFLNKNKWKQYPPLPFFYQ